MLPYAKGPKLHSPLGKKLHDLQSSQTPQVMTHTQAYTYTHTHTQSPGTPTPNCSPIQSPGTPLSLQLAHFPTVPGDLPVCHPTYPGTLPQSTPPHPDISTTCAFTHHAGLTYPQPVPSHRVPRTSLPCSLHTLLEHPPQCILPHIILSPISPPHCNSRQFSDLSPHTLLWVIAKTTRVYFLP